MNAHLLAYDTVHGTFNGDVSAVDDCIVAGSQGHAHCSEMLPENLPLGRS